MTLKKNAINISIIMIAVSLLLSTLCWLFNHDGALDLVYAFSTGIFGSSFATLWIFVYEYSSTKQELLKAIFDEAVSIMENNALVSLARFGFYDSDIKDSMAGKYYTPPVDFNIVQKMDKYERCHYELCRFIDEAINIDYSKLCHVGEMIESIDFWSDTFRRKGKYGSAIVHEISLPMYEVFVFAPGKENGYLFRYFNDFKINRIHPAEVVYPFVAELDQAIYGSNPKKKYSWQASTNLRGHMHEKLWIFRDAFYNPHIPRKQRRQAKRAFIKGTTYQYIR